MLEKKGEWDQALEYHARAHTIRQAIGDEWGVALSHLNIGIVHHLRGEWSQGQWHCEQVLDRAEQLEDPSTLALTCNTLGLIHHERGEDTQAQQYLEQALTWCQKGGDPHDTAQVHLGLGNLARDGGQWEQALQHYDQAEEFAGSLGSAPQLAHLALQRAHLYARQADWSKALPFGRQALSQWERLGNRQMILECLALLARVQLALEDRPAFTTLVDRATQLARDLDRTDVAVRLHWLRAEAALAGNEAPQAAAEYVQALKLCESSTNDRLRKLHGETQAWINDVIARLAGTDHKIALQAFRDELGALGARTDTTQLGREEQ